MGGAIRRIRDVTGRALKPPAAEADAGSGVPSRPSVTAQRDSDCIVTPTAFIDVAAGSRRSRRVGQCLEKLTFIEAR